MNTTSTCPECGKPIAPNGLRGLCPECMMKVGLVPQTGEVGPEGTQVIHPPPSPPTPAEVAKLFPQLEILGTLGCGGMGAIYKARQPRLDRLVALKILLRGRDDELRDARFRERFEREARALAKLSHPHIVSMYEFGEVEGLPYFIMEFVDGLNLRQLEQTGKLSPREALQIVPQICEALQFAHDAGVVHRDIKPENILLDRQGRVKIADFGIAKILGRESHASTLTQARQVIGTPHYMAPEQVEKPQIVDHRADIYSLGVVLYEMLTGELPLGKFAPPSKTVQVDVRLDEVVLHALEKQPERRYQQASEVKTDLETIAASGREGNPAAPPASPPAPAVAARSEFGNLVASFFGFNFTSPLALKLANLSALGFLCFLGFAPVPVPGWQGVFGFAGFFGLFGLAYFIEIATQREADARLEPSPRLCPAAAMGAWMAWFVPFSFLLTTALGWIAVARIRRSAGRLYGLGLAVFDGLLFPLLALDALIVFGALSLTKFAAGQRLNLHGSLFPDAAGAVTWTAVMLAILAGLDFLIIGLVWRRVNRRLERANDPEKSSGSGEQPSSTRFRTTNWALIGAAGLVAVGLGVLMWVQRPEPLDTMVSSESPDGQLHALASTWRSMRLFGGDRLSYRFTVRSRGGTLREKWETPVPIEALIDDYQPLEHCFFAKHGSIRWSEDSARVSFLVRGIEVSARNVNSGSHFGTRGANADPSRFSAAVLAASPKLRFIAERDYVAKSGYGPAWKPHGQVLGENEDAMLREHLSNFHSDLRGVPGSNAARLLRFWFSHPALDRSGQCELTLRDTNGGVIPAVSGSDDSFVTDARPFLENEGWFGASYGLDSGRQWPARVTVALEYALGPWADAKTAVPVKLNAQTLVSIPGGQINQVGQTVEGHAFVSLVRDQTVRPRVQWSFVARTRSGQVLEPVGAGRFGALRQQTERFEFGVPIADVLEFQLRSRPFKTIEYGDVILRPDAIARTTQTMVRQQAEMRLAAMKSRLRLTDDQEQAVRAILEKKFGLAGELSTMLIGGLLSKEEMDTADRAMREFDDQLRGIITQDQRVEYESWQVEQRRSQAQLAANVEVMELQPVLQLTQNQRGQVLQLLTRLHEQQLAQSYDGMKVPLDWEQQLDAMRDVLQPALNTEQLPGLDRWLDLQRETFRRLLAK